MKVFVFLLTVLFAVWLWRRNRLKRFKDKQTPTKEPSPLRSEASSALQPSPMQACHHCGLHMPESDMLPGQLGLYCSANHRQAASDNPP